MGDCVPPADPEWIVRLKRLGPRPLMRCAIAQLVHRAVQRRSVGVQEFYDPAELSAHLGESLFAQLSGEGTPCPAEPRWQAGRFRWRDVVRALRDADAHGDRDAPHPSAAQWRARGLDLRGRTWDEQLAEAERAQPSSAVPFNALFIGRPNRIDIAAKSLSRGATPEVRLGQALRQIGIATKWATFYLGRYAPKPGKARS